MLKVSVIMPCLNVEKYIATAIDSVVNQTLKDIEIIIVDAGSTDRTLDIIKEYKSKDSRIKLLNSPKKSYGYQMNIAIQAAKGEYIGIVETDDYIEEDAYEALYREISGTDADYIKGKAIAFFDQGNFKHERELKACLDLETKSKITLDPRKYPWLFISDNFIWNGIYRRDYLQRFPFRESPGAAFQDIGVLFQVISNAHKSIYTSKTIYHYRRGDALASSYNHNSLNFVRDEYDALEKLVPNLSDGWKYIYYRKMADHLLNRFHFMACEGKFWTESEKSIPWLQKNMHYALDNKILHKANFDIDEWEELQIFLYDAHETFEESLKNFRRRVEITLKTVEKLKNYDWVIFGSGSIGKSLRCVFRMYNIAVNAFCDNSQKKQGKFIDEVEILSPVEAVEKFPQSHFIVANEIHYREIKFQLLRLGVKRDLIYAQDISEIFFADAFTLQALYRYSLKK